MTPTPAGLILLMMGSLLVLQPSANAEELAGAVTTIVVPGGGKTLAARTDRAGTIHLLFDSADGPKYAKSHDEGAIFSAPILVVGQAPQPAGLEYSAWDLAIGKKGRVHVALGSNAWKLKLPEVDWGYFHAYLDPDSSAFSPLRNLNRKPSEGFSLAADDKGNVTACWLADKLYANVSHDNGETFEPYVEINPKFNPCNCCTTSACVGDDGKIAVFYREETDNKRDMYLILWDQKSGETSRTRISRTPWIVDACPMSYYTVNRAPGGGFTAVWPTRGQIDFARLDGKGTPKAPLEIKTPGFSGMRTGMIALSALDGRVLVAWKAAGQIGWQLYDAEGKPSGEPGAAESPGNGVAGVVGKDGRFILFR